MPGGAPGRRVREPLTPENAGRKLAWTAAWMGCLAWMWYLSWTGYVTDGGPGSGRHGRPPTAEERAASTPVFVLFLLAGAGYAVACLYQLGKRRR